MRKLADENPTLQSKGKVICFECVCSNEYAYKCVYARYVHIVVNTSLT